MSKKIEKIASREVLLVLVTCPLSQSDSIACSCLESKLATCINIVPQVKSYYRWQGKVQQDNESLMLIKCPADNYKALEKHVLGMHAYELPEIITVSIAGGLEEYLNWVLQPDYKQNRVKE